MISFPAAKINLGLNVLKKREDGFHDIETCLFRIPLCDILEVIEAVEDSLSVTGFQIDGDIDSNLVIKAIKILRQLKYFPPVALHLHKVIPSGAGLGGGSSDGTHALCLLNEMFNLGFDQASLEEMAAKLGSDCPFFLRNNPVIASGRGEIMKDISISLKGYYLIVVKPEVSVNTAWAYSKITPSGKPVALEAVVSQNPQLWKAVLTNSFEEVIFPEFPALEQCKNDLYDSGAIYASMSGSGSALFGIFQDDPVNLPLNLLEILIWKGRL